MTPPLRAYASRAVRRASSTTVRSGDVNGAAIDATSSSSASTGLRAALAAVFAATTTVTASCARGKDATPAFESEIKGSRSNKSGANAAFDPEALERGVKACKRPPCRP